MASSYTTNSGIEKPAEGDQTGEWGDTVNTNMDIIDRSINGVGAITLSGTTHTLTTTDGTLSDGMYKVLVLGGSPSGTNTITISPNDQDKVYIVVNGSGQTATFTQGSGGNVSVLNGDSKIIYADGAGSGAAVVDVTADLSFSSVNIDGGTIDGTVIGGASAAAGSFTTVTASGIIKTDNTTEATSTTDGSLQTDGGLSVVKDIVVGDDIRMLSNSAQIAFGASAEINMTHVQNTGLTITHNQAGNGAPMILQLKSEEDAIVADEVISSVEFAAGDSDGTDASTVSAGIHAIAEDTFSASANPTKLVFTTGVSESAGASATPKMTLSSAGNLTVIGEIDGASLDISGNADIDGTLETDALSIASTTVTSTAAELNYNDTGAAVGTVVASKTVTADANKDVASFRNITLTGELDAGSLDISGDADIDGTLETDALSIASTAVTATAAELNYLDITTLGTSEASKAVTVDSSGDLIVPDSDKFKFGAGSDMQLYHDGTNSYITNGTGILKIATETSGIAINIGHGTSEVTFGDNVTVTGDFTVNGTTTTINTTNLTVTDPLVKYGQGYTGTAYDEGFIITRGNGSATNTANKGFIWDESADEFAAIACNTEDGTTAGNVTINSYADLQVDKLTGGSLDISGDADIDGTLEADAMTLNGTAITTTATLSTGISNTNVPVFTSGVADDDFLRVAGTSIEGRSAAEVLSDIGASAVAGSGSIVTTGALNSGSITSGFGTINNGSSTITTSGVITSGSLLVGDAGTIGSASDTDAVAISSAGQVSFSATNAIKVPVGTTAQRPSNAAGLIRYNSTLSQFEGYTSAWGGLGGGATGGGADQVFVENSDDVTTNYTITSGKNAMSVGPITVESGVVVTIPSGSRWVVL